MSEEKKYLDLSGLTYLLSLSKNYVDTQDNAIKTAVEEHAAVCHDEHGKILSAITDAKVELLGDNTDATQTAILDAIKDVVNQVVNINKNAYAATFVQNSDGEDTWTMVLPSNTEVDEANNSVTL